MGTLTSDWVSSMELAAKTAKSLNKPWVLDPVGAGATPFRTKVLVNKSLTALCSCIGVYTKYAQQSIGSTLCNQACTVCLAWGIQHKLPVHLLL